MSGQDIVFDDAVDRPRRPKRLSRRAVLLGGAAAVAGFAVVRVVQEGSAPPAIADGRFEVPDVSLPVGEFDGLDGISPFTTPVEDHFYIDTALRKPQLVAETYTLTIGGPFVRNPLTLTYDDLLNFEQVTRHVCLACVSNPVGGDLVSNAVWTGVPLSTLLDEAGIDDPTNPDRQIFSTSVDGYTAGFRLPLAYDGRTAMVALLMNGEPLPALHGFPARLVVAGEYAFNSATKWLETIEVTDFAEVDGYWIPRGWAKEAPVKTGSRIDTPSDRAQLTPGTTMIGGVAWAPAHGIERVEVGFADAADFSDPDAARWVGAEVSSVDSDETWVQWRYAWDAPEGDWIIWVRATDKTGFTQSPVVRPPGGEGAEGFDAATVRA